MRLYLAQSSFALCSFIALRLPAHYIYCLLVFLCNKKQAPHSQLSSYITKVFCIFIVLSAFFLSGENPAALRLFYSCSERQIDRPIFVFLLCVFLVVKNSTWKNLKKIRAWSSQLFSSLEYLYSSRLSSQRVILPVADAPTPIVITLWLVLHQEVLVIL